MGLSPKISSSSFDDSSNINPNPRNFTIIKSIEKNKHTLIDIKYHNCTNYEGRKFLLFKCSEDAIRQQKIIDPHFSESTKYLSPIARFEPTLIGWNMGLKFLSLY